jgi:hypothetical protein
LPPDDPGGGITGVVLPLFRGGVTVMPGSTFGGVIMPFCRESRSLGFPFAGAIRSGGVTGTVGLVGTTGWAFWASAGAAASIIAASENVRSIMGILIVMVRPLAMASGVRSSTVLSDRP